jgi:hypothetical protein
MADTELQIAMQQVSEQKLRVLKQQSVMLGLRREGGQAFEDATELFDSMKDQLSVLEVRLERLTVNA